MQGSQFSVNEVEVVTATVDLDEVVRYRGGSCMADASPQAVALVRLATSTESQRVKHDLAVHIV